MAFCQNCGAQVWEQDRFCQSCGQPVRTQTTSAQQSGGEGTANAGNNQGNGQNNWQGTNAQPSSNPASAQSDEQKNKGMAILAYIGLLFLIPLFAAKDSRFARFHTNQGMVNCIAAIVFSIARAIAVPIFRSILWWLGNLVDGFFGLATLAFLIFAILGIIHAAQGEYKELPVLGEIHILN